MAEPPNSVTLAARDVAVVDGEPHRPGRELAVAGGWAPHTSWPSTVNSAADSLDASASRPQPNTEA